MTRPIIAALDPRCEDIAPAALGVMLARVTGAPLVLAAACRVDPPVNDRYPQHARALLREAEAVLKRAAKQVREVADLALTTIGVPSSGSSARELHALAELQDAGVLVLGSSSRGPMGRALPGAVTDRLLHGAPCPVAVAPAGFTLDDARPPRLVGAAFVDTPDGHLAVAMARSLAGPARALVRVLTVAEPLDLLVTSAPDALADASRVCREAAEATLARGVGAIPEGRSNGGRVLFGDAAHALAAASDELDLLVCGGRGHGPARTLLLGGTSHALVRRAACPVLVVPLGSHLPDIDAPGSGRKGVVLQEAGK
jgi:nucleotide-binding universal stress UspA family protein